MCVLCKKVEENFDHIFLHCNYMNEFWDILNSNLHNQWVIPLSLVDVIEQCRLEGGNKKSKLI